MTSPVRRLWQLLEPYHALTYFSPAAHQSFEAAGLRGFWRGYFAGRAAPLGAVGPGAVTATFYGFHPGFVARALPSVWTMVDPDEALRARLEGIDGALRPLLDGAAWEPRLGEAVALARRALDGADTAGRPLFAANMDLEWPAPPHLALWHAATLFREHRGDGHVAVLTTSDLDPCEAHLSQIAASGSSLDSIKPYRGWNDADWDAAAERLRSRGWLDADGRLTSRGRTARARVEDETDRLAAHATRHLAPEDLDRLLDLLTPVAMRLAETEAIPYPNPIGVPDPR